MKFSNRFFTNRKTKSHTTEVAAIIPNGRRGFRNSKLLSASRVRTIFHVLVYSFIFKGLNPFRQTKPHSNSFPYPNTPTSNSLKPRENIKELHIGSHQACVDRSVRGFTSLWRTGLLIHSELLYVPQLGAI